MPPSEDLIKFQITSETERNMAVIADIHTVRILRWEGACHQIYAVVL